MSEDIPLSLEESPHSTERRKDSPGPQINDERRRYFIVGTGRTGSTLLAAVMGDAGADFGMTVPERWDSGTGDLELRESQRATGNFYKAYRLSPEKPVALIDRIRWDIYRHRAKKHLANALGSARYIKCDNLDLAVQPAFQQGFFPKIILNYRRFEPHARSIYSMRGHTSVDWLAQIYNRVYRNGLLLLWLYGGCVVAYDDLVSSAEKEWAMALSATTGLSSDVLLKRRDLRSRGRADGYDGQSLDEAALKTFESLEALRGRTVPASRQAVRSWEARNAR